MAHALPGFPRPHSRQGNPAIGARDRPAPGHSRTAPSGQPAGRGELLSPDDFLDVRHGSSHRAFPTRNPSSCRPPSEQEGCGAWGSVSYTTEFDFRNETTDDCIVFYLSVKPETFASYAAKTAHGLLDEMILSVGEVDGFYSEWSPSISTRDVKVLTSGKEQKVALPAGHQFDPPRLGHVGDAALYINRRLEFDKRTPERRAVEEMVEVRAERAAPATQAPAAMDPQILQMLRSLRRAAWFIVWLLALIFIALIRVKTQ